MKLKTPSAWYSNERPPHWKNALLVPLAALYRLGYEVHQSIGRKEKFYIPIICVGNINAGGTGKTPVALALMEMIHKYKIATRPFFLSRGYGGGEYGPIMVEPGRHNTWHTGDEPLLLAKCAPTVVSRDRKQGILFAIQKGADLLVMDDGLQNPSLHKDLKIVVINGNMGFGNGKLLPVGPLREPLKIGLRRADAFVLIGKDERNVIRELPPQKPLFRTRLLACEDMSSRAGKSYIAFAGIGYPQKFFSFLRENGIDLLDAISFPDHYPYNEQDIERLQEKSIALNASLITTEKDHLRIPESHRDGIESFRIRLEWEDEEQLAQTLKNIPVYE